MLKQIVVILFIATTILYSVSPKLVKVVEPQTSITSNAFTSSRKLFLSPTGNIFEITEETSDHYRIKLPNNHLGWIHKKSVQRLAEVPPSIPTPSLMAIKIKKEPPKRHPYLMQENYRFPARPQNRNVDLEVDGFYEIKMSGRDYSPRSVTDSRWETIINDPVYNKIPKDVLLGPTKLDIRYKIKIDGKLDDDLSVHYDIEQEPDFPGKYEVQVKHKRKKLTFYHYNSSFQNGSFINTKKSLNGAHYYQEEDNWQTQIAMGRQRSEPKKFESFGNGQVKYKLGNSSILEGSVDVFFNNSRLSENVDYTVNYFDGSISFTKVVPQKNDFIEIIYEFTNPIEDFIPVLSRKNFTGLEFHYKTKDIVTKKQQKTHKINTLWSTKHALNIIASQNASTATKNKLASANILTALKSLFNSLPTPETTYLKDNDAPIKPSHLAHTISAPSTTQSISLIPPMFSSPPIAIPLFTSDNLIVVTTPSVQQTMPTKKTKSVINLSSVTPPKTFFIENTPIVLGSDEVRLNGVRLERNIDYFLDHSTGKFILKQVLSPTSSLDIHYDYYEIISQLEDKIGKDSAGPYQLQSFPIIDGSATVSLDDDILKEAIDYIIDYDEGQLYFNYNVPFPSVISIQYDAIKTQLSTQNVQKKPLEFGITYLNESARSQEEELTLSSATENPTVSNNILLTGFRPLTSTKDISIRLNNIAVPSTDYTIQSSYKGLIEFSPGVYTGQSVAIKYKYKKSFRAKFLFRVETERLTFTNTDNDFNVRDLPMTFNGVEFIRYFNPETGLEELLENGTDFVVNYGETGQTISLTFKTKTNSTSAAKLTHTPRPGDQFIMEYLYTPDEGLDPGNLTQTMAGLTIKTKLNDHWKVDAEIVGAKHNFSKPRARLSSPNILNGNGVDNHIYQLQNTNLVEDSELVFLNDLLQTKDQDYIINYIKGTVKFRNQTPQSQDVIKVFYDYFNLSGTTQDGTSSGYKLATKVGSTYQSKAVKSGVNFKFIDREFLPISPIKDKSGSFSLNSYLDWKVNPHDSLSFKYSRIHEDKGARNSESDRFYLRKDEFNSTSKIKLFKFFDTTNSFRYNFNIEDPKDKFATGNIHAIDTLTWGLNSKLSFGPRYFRTSASRAYSKRVNDYIDQVSLSTTAEENYAYSIYSNTKRIPFIQELSFSPSYSTGKSLTTDAAGTAYSKRKAYGYNSTIFPIKNMNVSLGFSKSTNKNKLRSSPSENITSIVNKHETVAYKPANWLSSRYSQALSESESPLISQSGAVSNKRSYGINKFIPYGLLIASGLSHFNPYIKPIKGSYTSFSKQESDKKENNLKKTTTSQSRSFSYNNLSPIPGLKLSTFQYNDSQSNINNQVQTQTTSANIANNESKKTFFNIIVAPKLPVLKLFSYTYSQRNTDSFKDNRTISRVSTSTITTEKTPYLNKTQKITLRPIQLRIPLWKKRSIRLGSISSYASESINNRNFVKNIYQVAPNDLESFSTTSSPFSFEEDTSRVKKHVLGVAISPFNLFSLNGTVSSSNTEIRRNLLKFKGIILKESLIYDIKGKYSPFRFISFSGTYKKDLFSQYQGPTLNITNNDLINERFQPSPDFNLFTSYLNKTGHAASIQTTLTPFRFISFVGGFQKSHLKERSIAKTNLNNVSVFEQEIETYGLILRPLKAMTLSADLKKLRTKQNKSTQWSGGDKTILKASYTPIQTKNIKVDIKYQRTITTGFDYNAIQNNSSVQSAGSTIETKIISRDDYIDLGSLNVQIKLPLNNSPFVREFVLEGEGHLKNIVDNRDSSYLTDNNPNTNPLSYDIFGLVIKGTLFF